MFVRFLGLFESFSPQTQLVQIKLGRGLVPDGTRAELVTVIHHRKTERSLGTALQIKSPLLWGAYLKRSAGFPASVLLKGAMSTWGNKVKIQRQLKAWLLKEVILMSWSRSVSPG